MYGQNSVNMESVLRGTLAQRQRVGNISASHVSRPALRPFVRSGADSGTQERDTESLVSEAREKTANPDQGQIYVTSTSKGCSSQTWIAELGGRRTGGQPAESEVKGAKQLTRRSDEISGWETTDLGASTRNLPRGQQNE